MGWLKHLPAFLSFTVESSYLLIQSSLSTPFEVRKRERSVVETFAHEPLTDCPRVELFLNKGKHIQSFFFTL